MIGAMYRWVLQRRVWRRTPVTVDGTLVDAPSPQRVLELVCMLERGDGADALADRMERLLATFLPTETTLRRLSLYQQSVEGVGGAQEYAITLTYVVAMSQAPRLLQRRRRLLRRHSWPRTKKMCV